MQITNVSPYGDLDVPLLFACVQAGETVDVTDEQAELLLAQAENFAPADDEAQVVADRIHKQVVEDEREALGIPARSAHADVWAEYARQQGDPEWDSLTKKQLVAKYGAVPSEEQS